MSEGAGVSELVSRNVSVNGRRTSLRLEPEFWESLDEIARREGVDVNAVVARVDAQRAHGGGLTSAVRTFVLCYFRSAALERGHRLVGHGVLFRDGVDA